METAHVCLADDEFTLDKGIYLPTTFTRHPLRHNAYKLTFQLGTEHTEMQVALRF